MRQMSAFQNKPHSALMRMPEQLAASMNEQAKVQQGEQSTIQHLESAHILLDYITACSCIKACCITLQDTSHDQNTKRIEFAGFAQGGSEGGGQEPALNLRRDQVAKRRRQATLRLSRANKL